MKRLFDIAVSGIALLLLWPVIAVALLLVWRQDGHWPLYSPPRIGKGGNVFHMHKMRSMSVGADRSAVDTTSQHDPRITPLGAKLRRFKLDELTQLWNVLVGEMSFVGPRPQIEREVVLYTEVEKGLLAAAPGITDFSSIVFSDLGEIVAPHADANLAYNQLVRPWKSRLGLFYIENQSIFLDIALIVLTAVAIASRAHALAGVTAILKKLHAPEDLIKICKRKTLLTPTPPPGSNEIVIKR